jgi:hypothetical protein
MATRTMNVATTMVGIGVAGRHNGGRKPERTDDGAAGQGHVVLHTDSFELMLEGVGVCEKNSRHNQSETLTSIPSPSVPIPRSPFPLTLDFRGAESACEKNSRFCASLRGAFQFHNVKFGVGGGFSDWS